VCQRHCWRDLLLWEEVEPEHLDPTSSWLQVVKLQIRRTLLWYQLKGSRCQLEGVNSRTWNLQTFYTTVSPGPESRDIFPDTPRNPKNPGKCPDSPACEGETNSTEFKLAQTWIYENRLCTGMRQACLST
jgi:hypothetical protein